MSGTVVEFTAGQYQSVFQLAAALNFGLSIFKVLRQPAQEKVMQEAKALIDLASNSSKLAASRIRLLEQSARDTCIRLGKNPDTEFTTYVDQSRHSRATDMMVASATLEIEAQDYLSEIANKTNDWLSRDDFVEKLAVIFFFLALLFLGHSTLYASVEFDAVTGKIFTKVYELFALFMFSPVLLSFLFALLARRQLSALRKEIRSCERNILRQRLTL